MTYKLIKELALYPINVSKYMAIPDSKIYNEVLKNRWFDSAYGDILFVKVPRINNKYLDYLKLKIQRDLQFLIKTESLKNNPNIVIRYIKNSLKNPNKIVNFIKNIPRKNT